METQKLKLSHTDKMQSEIEEKTLIGTVRGLRDDEVKFNCLFGSFHEEELERNNVTQFLIVSKTP